MGPSADGATFCHMAYIIPGKANHDAEDTESGGDTMAASAEDTRHRNNLLLLLPRLLHPPSSSLCRQPEIKDLAHQFNLT